MSNINFSKNEGETLRHDEWNALGDEFTRLENKIEDSKGTKINFPNDSKKFLNGEGDFSVPTLKTINVNPEVEIVKDDGDAKVTKSETDNEITLSFSLPKGDKGDTGKTYVPSVSESGDLSWSLEDTPKEATPTNIQGPQGERGRGLDVNYSKSGKTTTVNITTDETTPELLKSFQILDGNDGHNPCLGRFTSKPSSMPEGQLGDYIYVDTVQEGVTTTEIYHYTSNGWDENGTEVDISNETFNTGEHIHSVNIDDTELKNPAFNALAKATDVKAIVQSDDVADFDIADDNGKVIMRLENGEIVTKNFNSAATPVIGDTNSVFDIADSQGHVIMRIDSQGHVLTYGFDSRRVALKDVVNNTDACITAFVSKMNEYAINYGMANTHFLNASGQNKTGHYSTAKDIMRMCACCTAYEKLMRYWGLETFTFHVGGDNARDITVNSTYKGNAMTSVGNYYHIYGGKSGTWNVGGSVGTVRNLTLVVKSNIDDTWLVGCVIKATDTDRGIAFKQLMDWLEAYRQNPTTQQPTINADYAAAGIIQPHNPMAYADVDYCLVAKSGDTQYLPASMTKLMTAMVVLDYCSLDETLTIIASDIQSGTPTFYAGDKISIADAIPAMLLPSSNTLAVALSRYVGNKIINIKNK